MSDLVLVSLYTKLPQFIDFYEPTGSKENNKKRKGRGDLFLTFRLRITRSFFQLFRDDFKDGFHIA